MRCDAQEPYVAEDVISSWSLLATRRKRTRRQAFKGAALLGLVGVLGIVLCRPFRDQSFFVSALISGEGASRRTITVSPDCLTAGTPFESSHCSVRSSVRLSSAPKNMLDEFQSKLKKKKESGENDESKTGWLSWMMGGKPRGTNKVIMREAVELGGVARSDRYSSRDWFHNTVTLPNSAILREIRSPVIAVTSWSVFLSILHQKLLVTNPAAAAHMHLSMAPHSLMMSALGLLLVFRTNSAYQRFAEGRVIWENIINSARDLYRMLMLYENEIGVDKRRRVQRLLAAFPYLLRHRIRPNLVMRPLDDDQYERDPQNTILLYQDRGPKDLDIEAAAVAQTEEETGSSRRKRRPLYWVDKRSLPWRLLPAGALEKCARTQNRPLWVCDRMSQEIRSVPDGPNFTSRERLTIISHIDKLSHCIGGAERIHQTVIPLNYARHTLRALTCWLFSLPFALVKDLRSLTGPVVFLVAWLLFGVYEIGVRIEDPFQGTLRLSIMCDTVRRDVLGDEAIRSTAFQLESEDEEEDDFDDEELEDDEEDIEEDELEETNGKTMKRASELSSR